MPSTSKPRARTSVEFDPVAIRTRSFPFSSTDLLEVEISQIHVAVRQYVDGENIFPFAETNLEELLSQIPVVPLAPGHGVRRIIGGPDLKRACFVRSVNID